MKSSNNSITPVKFLVEEAKKKWAIDFKSYKSFTNPTSRIIEIKKAKRIGN